MPRIIAVVVEWLAYLCALWFLTFLSTFLHEFGHALGYMLATQDSHWHIRVGWGKRLLNTKALTVNLLVFDGFFTPSDEKIDTKAKLLTMLLGGPVASLLLVVGFLFLRFGGLFFQSDILADGVVDALLNFTLYLNLFLLLFSLASMHYFGGEVRGHETDGLQIIHTIRKKGN